MENIYKFRKIFLFNIAFLVAASSLLGNESKSKIEEVNTEVETIERAIKIGEYSVLNLESQGGQIESVLPNFHFFFDFETSRIIAIIVKVGHETWNKTFYYYFDKNEKIMKYLEVIDRSDNPPRLAIIYKSNGDILWSNMERPTIEPKDLKEYFKRALSLQRKFSSY